MLARLERFGARASLRYIAIALAAIALFVVWDELDRTVLDRPKALVLAFGLSILGVLGGSASWAVLNETGTRWRAIDAFVAAQPAKYLPAGGALQIATQVGLSSPSGSLRNTSGLAVIHAALQVLTALFIGVAAIVGLAVAMGTVAFALFVACLFATALLTVPLIVRIIAVRLPSRFRIEVPCTRTLTMSVSLTAIPLISSGIALAVLGGTTIASSVPMTISAFSAAWAVGFLALPIPSGAVVRETVLVLLLAIGLRDLLAISLAHRTVVIVAELTLVAILSLWNAVARKASS